jgi:hypothetical protein
MEISFDVINAFVQWIVLPLTGLAVYIYQRQNNHHTDIAVLKTQHEANKVAHGRELKELKTSIAAIFSKLDSIEQALRK